MKEHMDPNTFERTDWTEFLAAIDSDKNGVIDFQEFMVASLDRQKAANS